MLAPFNRHTRPDNGPILILDRRVLRKGYGRSFLAGLPDYRRFADGDPVS
jgi:Rad3-related DNA helicase